MTIKTSSTQRHHAAYFPYMFVDCRGELLWKNNPTVEIAIPEILFITSFPPRECGIATYSSDLLEALRSKFGHTFKLVVCALESNLEQCIYPEPPKFILNTDLPNEFSQIALAINNSINIQAIVVQHEFGFFRKQESAMLEFWQSLKKPLAFVFHTVLPFPDPTWKQKVQVLSKIAQRLVVMTDSSAVILSRDYGISKAHIETIPHGTHLVPHLDRSVLKAKYGLTGKRILTTFGLLNEGKSIETTIDALPSIIENYPDVLFLIIGVTHPMVFKQQGEWYREMLVEKISALGLGNHVKFINDYLPVATILEYLQLTDIYLFTSKDRNQAVSGTMSYAIGCGCAVVSTPIPHAMELLNNNVGEIIDFEDSTMLSKAVVGLFNNELRMGEMGSNGLHRMASTAWQNSAISHAAVFQSLVAVPLALKFTPPPLNLDHIEKLTTSLGMIQFSVINQPDIRTGYTLDDNARALIAMCKLYKFTQNTSDLRLAQIYFDFVRRCFQLNGVFLNYVDADGNFTDQNYLENLEDSNGRALWALGYVISLGDILPIAMVGDAIQMFQAVLPNAIEMHSTRAMSFVVKGLYYKQQFMPDMDDLQVIKTLCNRLVQMFQHESNEQWQWFESYLTYGNSVIPEALLCGWMVTGEQKYRDIAKSTFDFLLSIVFQGKELAVVSNQGWLHRTQQRVALQRGGEQPIDVAYMVMALQKYIDVFGALEYEDKIQRAFDWFLGANHLKQIIYNPCTGGCYDGLEKEHVNLNQGAESTVSYLMARLTYLGGFKSRKEFLMYEKNYR